jgi:hypothetical protein
VRSDSRRPRRPKETIRPCSFVFPRGADSSIRTGQTSVFEPPRAVRNRAWWRTATINQIRAFLIEQGIAVRSGLRTLRKSLFAILENRRDEISPRTARLILGLYGDWCGLDERIEALIGEAQHRTRVSHGVGDGRGGWRLLGLRSSHGPGRYALAANA